MNRFQLDPKAVTTVSSMLKRINEELGVTVIVVSHSSEEFIDFCDRLVILENGEIICNDTPYNAKTMLLFCLIFLFVPVFLMKGRLILNLPFLLQISLKKSRLKIKMKTNRKFALI